VLLETQTSCLQGGLNLFGQRAFSEFYRADFAYQGLSTVVGQDPRRAPDRCCWFPNFSVWNILSSRRASSRRRGVLISEWLPLSGSQAVGEDLT
jgi:hypothetical protein